MGYTYVKNSKSLDMCDVVRCHVHLFRSSTDPNPTKLAALALQGIAPLHSSNPQGYMRVIRIHFPGMAQVLDNANKIRELARRAEGEAELERVLKSIDLDWSEQIFLFRKFDMQAAPTAIQVLL